MPEYNAIMLNVPDGTEDSVLCLSDSADYIYLMPNLVGIAGAYTFSVWARADIATSVIFNILGSTYQNDITTEWKRIIHTVEVTSNFNIGIRPTGNESIYFYKGQLETGKVATDWKPAPEDVNDNIDSVTSELHETIVESYSELSTSVDAITSQVGEVVTTVDELSQTVEEQSTQITQTKDDITMTFSSRFEEIEETNGTLTSYVEEEEKYIRFSDGNIYLGYSDGDTSSIENLLVLKISNNRISYLLNEQEVGYFAYNGFHSERAFFDESAQVGYYMWKDEGDNGFSLIKSSTSTLPEDVVIDVPEDNNSDDNG